MPKIHLIKRNDELNNQVGKKLKQGLQWYTQTSLKSRPKGSNAVAVSDEVYIYQNNYGIWAKGKITDVIHKGPFDNFKDVINFSLKCAKDKNKSYWGEVILDKLGQKEEFKFYVLQVQIDLTFLIDILQLDNLKAEKQLNNQSSWITLDHPIEKISYRANQLSTIISPSLRAKIHSLFAAKKNNNFVYDVDHFVPSSIGGPGSIEENLMPMHYSSNRYKSDKIPIGLFIVAKKEDDSFVGPKTLIVRWTKGREDFIPDHEAKKAAQGIITNVNKHFKKDEPRVRKFYKKVRDYHFPDYSDLISKKA